MKFCLLSKETAPRIWLNQKNLIHSHLKISMAQDWIYFAKLVILALSKLKLGASNYVIFQ
jgi:hypothetical protein